MPLGAAVLLAALLALQPSPSWLKPQSRVSANALVEAPRPGAAAGTLVVAVDVIPAPGIHVYAPGNKDYIPVELKAEARAGLQPGKAEYPPSEPFVFGDLKEVVQVYAKRFRIRLPLTLDRATPRPATMSLSLRYQACTDTVCFPPATMPLEVALPPAR